MDTHADWPDVFLIKVRLNIDFACVNVFLNCLVGQEHGAKYDMKWFLLLNFYAGQGFHAGQSEAWRLKADRPLK
jgi:hypothetical protein